VAPPVAVFDVDEECVVRSPRVESSTTNQQHCDPGLRDDLGLLVQQGKILAGARRAVFGPPAEGDLAWVPLTRRTNTRATESPGATTSVS